MNAPLPPRPDQQEELPELVLDTRPEGASREWNRLPPYSGLLIIVLIGCMLAVGYAIYRDTHPDLVQNPAPAAEKSVQNR